LEFYFIFCSCFFSGCLNLSNGILDISLISLICLIGDNGFFDLFSFSTSSIYQDLEIIFDEFSLSSSGMHFNKLNFGEFGAQSLVKICYIFKYFDLHYGLISYHCIGLSYV
jgi:hypothetical protein